MGNAWHRVPDQPSQVVTLAGRTVTPCGSVGVVTVESLSATAAQALCANGDLVETSDAGATWADVARTLDIVGIDNRLDGAKIVATVGYLGATCQGIQLASVSAGDLTKLACAELTADALAVAKVAGSVALATRDTQLWLQVGTELLFSDDGGKTVTAR